MKLVSVIFAFLVAAGMIMFGCKKNTVASTPQSHTRNMAGMHVWAGVEYDYTSGINSLPDTVVNFSGQSSDIVVINDNTIVYRDTLKYIYTNNKDTLVFAAGQYADSTSFVYDTLWYNYSLNEIGYRLYFASLYNAYPYFYLNEHTP